MSGKILTTKQALDAISEIAYRASTDHITHNDGPTPVGMLMDHDAALRDLVAEFANELIVNGMPEHRCDLPEGAPPESYRSCDWCGAYGPEDPYAMEHGSECWAGLMLARAKACAR